MFASLMRDGSMRSLLPPEVVLVEAGAGEWEAPPLREESALVERAVLRRRREFAAGRACARRALELLGFPPAPLPAGPNRAPLWPEGAVGSITHCGDYCAAAVARTATVRALGIDAELNEPLPPGVAELVCTPAERDWVSAAGPGPVHWPTLIFSAKESLYKAWQPLTGGWLGYLDAELHLDCQAGTFQATPAERAGTPAGLELNGLRGRFAATPTHLLTAVLLPAD